MDSDIIGRRTRELLGDVNGICTATNRAGERCGNSPIIGGTVCHMHGGKVPAVQRTARERLLAMVDPALNALLRVLQSHGPPCTACGRSDADRDPVVVRAAQIVLDRTGYGPHATVSVTPPAAPYAPYLTREELTTIGGIIANARRRMESNEPLQDTPRQTPPSDVVTQDGVLIDEQEETKE